MLFKAVLLLVAWLVAHAHATDCSAVTLDFVLHDGDASAEAIQDDIAADLAKVGISINARYVGSNYRVCWSARHGLLLSARTLEVLLSCARATLQPFFGDQISGEG